MHVKKSVLMTVALGLAGVAASYAANQNILGSGFLAKNPSSADKRRVTIKAKEKPSADTIVGDPTATGATLRVTVSGGSPSTQTVSLPQGTSLSGKQFWSGDAIKGFKYKDSKFENGPVSGATIKKTASGIFSIGIKMSGKIQALNVTPPNPGTNACALLTITGGDSYSVAFPPMTGTIANKGTALYKHKKPGAEASCTTTTTTTTTSTTTTTIPACSPNCPINNPCFSNGQCASGLCSGGVCKCPNHAYTFTTNSNNGGSVDSAEWPGGTQLSTHVTGCSATINQPANNIDLVCSISDHFSVNTWTGYSSCFGTGGEDGDGCNVSSCPPAGVGSCCTGRPSCSAALNGSATATYSVQCLQ